MKALIPYIIRSLTRARARTALTILGVVVGMTLFGFVRSMDHGMRSLAQRVERPDMLIVFERNTICPFQARIPQRYDSEISKMEGVERVLPTRLYMNSCRANLDLITLYGIPKDSISTFFPALGVSQSDLAAFEQRSDGALMGTRVAKRRGLKSGEQVEVGSVTAQIVGSFNSGEEGFLDNVIFMHLDHLLTSLPGGETNLGVVTQHLVKLKPNADADAIATAIDERFARDDKPTRTRPLAEFVSRAIGEIEHVISFAQLLGYLAVAVMALILMNTVFMSAQARRDELAMLQVLGTTRFGMFAAVIAESLILAVIGAAVGLGAVYVGLTFYPLGIGVEGYQVDFVPSSGVLIEGAVLACVIGVFAGIGPAVQSVTTSLNDSLRAE